MSYFLQKRILFYIIPSYEKFVDDINILANDKSYYGNLDNYDSDDYDEGYLCVEKWNFNMPEVSSYRNYSGNFWEVLIDITYLHDYQIEPNFLRILYDLTLKSEGIFTKEYSDDYCNMSIGLYNQFEKLSHFMKRLIYVIALDRSHNIDLHVNSSNVLPD